jgi:D-sedoheptulose 7-phosphate isomerase
MTFALEYLHETAAVVAAMDPESIERLVESLRAVRDRGGRVFVLGLGGSAANASHCVNDLRVRAGIEAYTPTDNVAELTARVNDGERDYGWWTCLEDWLYESRVSERDALLVFSGSGESIPLCTAVEHTPATVLGVLGTANSRISHSCEVQVQIPLVNKEHRAGHAEAFQAVVWHACVAHPRLAV